MSQGRIRYGNGSREMEQWFATRVPRRKGRIREPPAVLVKVAAGSSYADTVSAVKQNSELNLTEMSAQVTGMRRTRDWASVG
jgi:hypothetical protein